MIYATASMRLGTAASVGARSEALLLCPRMGTMWAEDEATAAEAARSSASAAELASARVRSERVRQDPAACARVPVAGLGRWCPACASHPPGHHLATESHERRRPGATGSFDNSLIEGDLSRSQNGRACQGRPADEPAILQKATLGCPEPSVSGARPRRTRGTRGVARCGGRSAHRCASVCCRDDLVGQELDLR